MSATSTPPTTTPTSTASHERYVKKAQERDEPSRTRTLRANYGQRLRGRWAAIMAALRQGIVDFDAFGLQTEALVDPPRGFAFETEAQQVTAFDQWLQRQTEREILRQYGSDNQFVEQAYERGVGAARTELRTLNLGPVGEVSASALQLPVHREQLQALYTRNYGALQGMTDATANQMRRVLTEGLASSHGPERIARDLADRVDHVGKYRSNLIARTEVMHSHNRARATEWSRAGIKQVDIMLAPGACPECQALAAGGPYSIDEAPGLLPLHPQCKCALSIHTEE
ncbi:phage minor head protein [Haloferax namakaokahaiae]|uniref:Phage minor head protein n=1 Tax=Haloferax namakaokahaiae TaxID=1748331 RepID=A0ABD5ZCI8_9EURY